MDLLVELNWTQDFDCTFPMSSLERRSTVVQRPPSGRIPQMCCRLQSSCMRFKSGGCAALHPLAMLLWNETPTDRFVLMSYFLSPVWLKCCTASCGTAFLSLMKHQETNTCLWTFDWDVLHQCIFGLPNMQILTLPHYVNTVEKVPTTFPEIMSWSTLNTIINMIVCLIFLTTGYLKKHLLFLIIIIVVRIHFWHDAARSVDACHHLRLSATG